MKIGIDISQIVHEGSGVARYVRRIVASLVRLYPENEYVLFGASLRKRRVFAEYAATLSDAGSSVRLVTIPVPPTILELLWNRWSVLPVEWFTGEVDVFWSSDWTQPPLTHAIGVTTIHDVSVLRFPEESHNQTKMDIAGGQIRANIVATQKRRLQRAARICRVFFCDSHATKNDAHEMLDLAADTLKVVYPGYEGRGTA